ncbi:MAG: hypothetical protein KJZ57_08240, partial [Anaerolineales bacterium]|nr:hypothetical protein [Anaerolineales bacterium]
LRRYFRSMTSEQVAERVVEIAKRPRRAVVMPWYYNLAIWADWYMPWFVDWITESALTKKRHKYK